PISVRGEDPLRQRATIDAPSLELVEVGDLRRLDELCRQHLLRRELGNDRWELDHRIVLEVRRDERDILGLLPEVQLVPNHRADLGMVRLESTQSREELNDR